TGLESGEALPALWELVWAGEVTNDAWTPLRAPRRYGAPQVERRPRRFARSRGGPAVATQGRWSVASRLFEGVPDPRALAALVLAAADPAQPYGASLPWPKRAGARAARVAGAHVVLLAGAAALFVERGGRSLIPLRDPEPDWLRRAFEALVLHVRAGGAK